MKKVLLFVAVACTAVAFTSCNSSKESAYRKAYEKAKAQEQVQEQVQEYQPVQQTPVVTPLVEAPQQTVTVQDNTPVRSENVQLISGSGLKAYSVVVGSFGVRANAEGLQQTLKRAGYDAQIAYNSERNMYRVVASTFDTRDGAISSKSSLKSTYPDAWLLLKN